MKISRRRVLILVYAVTLLIAIAGSIAFMLLERNGTMDRYPFSWF